MKEFVRERTGLVSAVLSVVALALVFAAAGQQIPQSVLPDAPSWVLDAIPHANVVISVAAIGTILAGVRAIKHGNIERHRTLMVTSFVLFAGFLVMYLYRVALLGPQEFPGPDTIYQFIYLPTLVIHIILAVICVPLVFHALLLAASRPVHELPNTRHPTVGKAAAVLWVISFALGTVVYLFLYVVY